MLSFYSCSMICHLWTCSPFTLTSLKRYAPCLPLHVYVHQRPKREHQWNYWWWWLFEYNNAKMVCLWIWSNPAGLQSRDLLDGHWDILYSLIIHISFIFTCTARAYTWFDSMLLEVCILKFKVILFSKSPDYRKYTCNDRNKIKRCIFNIKHTWMLM